MYTPILSILTVGITNIFLIFFICQKNYEPKIYLNVNINKDKFNDFHTPENIFIVIDH